MPKQSFEVTESMFQNFETLATFVEHQATEAEAMALLALVTPLNKALNKKVGHRHDVETGE